jgi:enoyl-CoA hydratase/carnithine racemase
VSLTQVIPWAVANEIVLLGQRFSAQRAYEMGLINRVVPRDQLEDAALEYANALAAHPPVQLALTLRMLRKVQPQFSDEVYEEHRLLHDYQLTLGDAKEAARAFAERRDARFSGAATAEQPAP